jgi:hypothetical protein
MPIYWPPAGSKNPIFARNDTGTRTNPLADGSRLVAEMLSILWYSLCGKYEDGVEIRSPLTVSASQRPRAE